jgi:hypothetical protein
VLFLTLVLISTVVDVNNEKVASYGHVLALHIAAQFGRKENC